MRVTNYLVCNTAKTHKKRKRQVKTERPETNGIKIHNLHLRNVESAAPKGGAPKQEVPNLGSCLH